MACSGAYAEAWLRQEKRDGLFSVYGLLTKAGQSIMTILAQGDQILWSIILLLHRERLPVSVNMMDMKASSAATKLTLISIALQNLRIAPVALLGFFVTPLATALVTGCSGLAVIGISGVNGGPTARAEVFCPTTQNSMAALSFLQQVIAMFLFVALLTVSTILARWVNAAARTKTSIYAVLTVCSDFVQALTAIHHTGLRWLAATITKALGHPGLAIYFHLVKTCAAVDSARFGLATTKRALSLSFSGSLPFTICSSAHSLLPPRQIYTRKDEVSNDVFW